jgi:Tfp pilus assembly protein PilF
LLGVEIARRMGDKNGAASFELKLRSSFPDSEEYRQLRGAEFR